MKKTLLVTTAALSLSLTSLAPIKPLASTDVGTNVLDHVEISQSNQPIENGQYKIITMLNNKSSMWNQPLELSDTSDEYGLRDHFYLHYVKEKNAYFIKTPDGLLNLKWDGKEGTHNLKYNGGDWPTPTTDADYWILESTGEKDTYYIKNKENLAYVLDVHNANPNNGTKIKVSKKHYSDAHPWHKNAQKFKLEKY